MIFNLIRLCNISYSMKTSLEIFLPEKKLNIVSANKKLITIHLSERWINNFYNEENFLDLVLLLPKNKYQYALTTDNSSRNKFSKIYNYFEIIDNTKIMNLKKLKNEITILNKLTYENWINVIYSSDLVITPECGSRIQSPSPK